MAQTRLNKVLRELNISIDRAVDFLESKGIEIEKSPNTKISQEVYDTLSDEFQTDATKREKAQEVSEAKLKEKEALREKRERELEEKEREEKAKEEAREAVLKAKAELSGPKQVGKIDLEGSKPKKEETPKKTEKTPKVEDKPKVAAKKEAPKASKTAAEKEETPKGETPKAESKTEKPKAKAKKEETEEESSTTNEPVDEKIKTQYQKLSGPKNTGQKIDLAQFNKPKKKKEDKKPAANADANKPVSYTHLTLPTKA